MAKDASSLENHINHRFSDFFYDDGGFVIIPFEEVDTAEHVPDTRLDWRKRLDKLRAQRDYLASYDYASQADVLLDGILAELESKKEELVRLQADLAQAKHEKRTAYYQYRNYCIRTKKPFKHMPDLP